MTRVQDQTRPTTAARPAADALKRYWVSLCAIALALGSFVYLWANQGPYCPATTDWPVYESDTVELPFTDPADYQREQRYQQELTARQRNMCTAYWTMGAAWIGVVLLFGTLIEAFRTASAAETAITDARDNAQRELRAYVTLNDVTITNFEVGEPILTKIRMTNTGKTPAYDYRGNWGIGIIPTTMNWTHKDLKEKADSRYTLGPGVEASAYEADKPDDPSQLILTQEHADAITSGAMTLMVIGCDYYTDAFGKPRRTAFRYERTGPVRCPQRMRVCAEGNEST